MTGAYVRIYRNGEWQNIEIDQLNESEIDEFMKTMDTHRLVMWIKFLIKFIKNNVGVTGCGQR